jgi:hypothetical protein
MVAFAAWPRDTFQDSAGNILPDLNVEIRRESDNGLATLFTARDGSSQTSPLGETTTDSEGKINVYVQGGVYKVVDKDTEAVIRRYVAVGTGAERDAPDGRSVFEASPVSDAESEFAAGGTFTINPGNPRHRYLKVHDSGTPLTQSMIVDLDVENAAWLPGDVVTVVKGDDSQYLVQVSGFDTDGLGVTTLRRSRDAVECIFQSTDSATGPGPGGGKFERGHQSRINPLVADISDFDAGVAAAEANWRGDGTESLAEAVTALADGESADITPADLAVTGSPVAGSPLLYDSSTGFLWGDGLVTGATHSRTTLDTGATLTAADHARFVVSGANLVEQLIVARNSSDQSATVTLTLEENCAKSVRVTVADDQTGVVTINRAGTNTFNGSATSIVLGGPGATVDIEPGRTSGDFRVEGEYIATRTLLGNFSGNGYQIYGHVAKITEPTGAYSATIDDSGALIITDGDLTIPTTAGFHCMVQFGGDDDLVFNGDTYDTGATAGDVCSVIVTSSTTILVLPLVAAITEGDFA